MATRIYGASDDLIEFEGDVHGETGGGDKPTLVVCSDGTLLEVKYGKPMGGIWSITLVQTGNLFECIEVCTEENEDPYSDVARFRGGLKWAIAASKWEKVH